MADEWWLLIGFALAIWILRVVMKNTKDEQAKEMPLQEKVDFDLGLLSPTLFDLSSGLITREQADQVVDQLTPRHPSAVKMWYGMSEEERSELGEKAILLFADPIFQAQQSARIQEVKLIDPELFAQAEHAAQQMKNPPVGQEEPTDEMDDFFRDLLKLKEVDPEGFEQVLAALKERSKGD